MKITAIVLAGGRGSRMNSDVPKQYMLLDEKPVLYYSLRAFEKSEVDEIIIVAGADDIDYCRREIVQKYNINKVKHIVAGGKERYDSVMNGLCAATQPEGTYVLIHDGARPCISGDVIKRCIEDVKKYNACVAAVPVKDTIKIADSDGYAKHTPDRSTLWQIQTPQCFEYKLVKKAYEDMLNDSSRGTITDDAMVVEQYTDVKVKLTMSAYQNMKITTPEDMLIAKMFLR